MDDDYTTRRNSTSRTLRGKKIYSDGGAGNERLRLRNSGVLAAASLFHAWLLSLRRVAVAMFPAAASSWSYTTATKKNYDRPGDRPTDGRYSVVD